jgi:glycosyltransferase involved in cell wall biosynthesis
VPTACIPLGWDPASAATPDEGDSAQLEPDTCSLAHFGSLTLPGRRDPTGLFEGLRRFAEREPQLAGRTRLVLVGAVSAAERELIDRQDPAVRGMIRELGGLPRAEAVALQRRADALVLLATGPYRSVSTTKLYEYLFANRPILALSTPNEATRIVGETGTGAVVDPDDPAAIAQAIADVAGGRLAEAYAPRGLEAYAQPGLAERFEAQIERAITLRARSR